MPGEWIDISTPLRTGMRHWPGDPEVEVRQDLLSMHPHTGTHIDAPRHYLPEGRTIDELPFSAVMGAARVVELQSLDAGSVAQGSRILLKGATDEGITGVQAEGLAARAPACLGIDSLSIGDANVHRTVLAAGIWVIEGLDLSRVEAGDWEVLCLPLRIEAADGAPARALLRRPG